MAARLSRRMKKLFFRAAAKPKSPAVATLARIPAVQLATATAARQSRPTSRPDAGGAENDHVPLATFLEEKKARKELATKYQETEKQLAELRGKFAIIDRLKLGGEDPAAQQPAGPPKVEDDIFGAVKHVTETLAQMEKRTADEKAAKEANEKAATEQKTFVDNYTGLPRTSKTNARFQAGIRLPAELARR